MRTTNQAPLQRVLVKKIGHVLPLTLGAHPRPHPRSGHRFIADVYWRTGGFAALASSEDVDLVQHLTEVATASAVTRMCR